MSKKVKPRHRTRTCNGMRRYRDETEAKQALRRLKNSMRETTPTRWFSCENCGGIHTSSKQG